MAHAADDADLIALAARLGLHSLDLEQLRAINRLRSAPSMPMKLVDEIGPSVLYVVGSGALPMSVRQDPSTWDAAPADLPSERSWPSPADFWP